jgi:hypothetical protein
MAGPKEMNELVALLVALLVESKDYILVVLWADYLAELRVDSLVSPMEVSEVDLWDADTLAGKKASCLAFVSAAEMGYS